MKLFQRLNKEFKNIVKKVNLSLNNWWFLLVIFYCNLFYKFKIIKNILMEQTRTALKNEKKLARIVNEIYNGLMVLSEDSRPKKIFLKNAEQPDLIRAMHLLYDKFEQENYSPEIFIGNPCGSYYSVNIGYFLRRERLN